ncbi:MAG: YraN family protein [Mitsuokella jalaludinii]|uniref:YraN family protein n=1 Tax=Mitsuokella jalaludinii TaxID=187979 RepID=UPI0022E3409C|nr:YraN family protein [Mitsuokella jalaludinii]MCI6606388.1 YraN family protein [Mitsuokella jalaludinii]
MDTTKLGRQGEEAAAVFLKEAGYEILARNFRTPRGEIDIVAGTEQTVAFIEVKTRRTRRFGRPAAAVDYRKQQKIIQSARWFLRQRHLDGCLCRFDVIEVCVAGERWEIHHLPGAFET